MNEIRKNKEEEVVQLRVRFDMPTTLKVLYLIPIIIFAIIAVILFIVVGNTPSELKGFFDDYDMDYGFDFGGGFSMAIIPLVVMSFFIIFVKNKSHHSTVSVPSLVINIYVWNRCDVVKAN